MVNQFTQCEGLFLGYFWLVIPILICEINQIAPCSSLPNFDHFFLSSLFLFFLYFGVAENVLVCFFLQGDMGPPGFVGRRGGQGPPVWESRLSSKQCICTVFFPTSSRCSKLILTNSLVMCELVLSTYCLVHSICRTSLCRLGPRAVIYLK